MLGFIISISLQDNSFPANRTTLKGIVVIAIPIKNPVASLSTSPLSWGFFISENPFFMYVLCRMNGSESSMYSIRSIGVIPRWKIESSLPIPMWFQNPIVNKREKVARGIERIVKIRRILSSVVWSCAKLVEMKSISAGVVRKMISCIVCLLGFWTLG